MQERASASRLAASQAGRAMMKDVAKEKQKSNTFTPGGPAAAENNLTAEHRRIYAERIAAATTVEEVRVIRYSIQHMALIFSLLWSCTERDMMSLAVVRAVSLLLCVQCSTDFGVIFFFFCFSLLSSSFPSSG